MTLVHLFNTLALELNCILLLDYKSALLKCGINITSCVGIEGYAIGK